MLDCVFAHVASNSFRICLLVTSSPMSLKARDRRCAVCHGATMDNVVGRVTVAVKNARLAFAVELQEKSA